MENIEVYKAIAAVQGALAKEGISKDLKNNQQGFMYRGIDQVYAALAPLLSQNNLCILPRIVGKEVVERINTKGTALFYTTVEAQFDVVSAVDGSAHTVSSYGEAMDSGDKSIGKAMSYAYKAMAFMLFAIPTVGDNDPDAATHEVKPFGNAPSRKANPPVPSAMGEVQQALYNELSDYCRGDTEDMDECCKEMSFYEQGGKEYQFGTDKLTTVSNKWAYKVLSALKKRREDETANVPDGQIPS